MHRHQDSVAAAAAAAAADTATKARARGRWKLLQQALLSRNSDNSSTNQNGHNPHAPTESNFRGDTDGETGGDTDAQQHSKRHFAGYRMLESKIFAGNDSAIIDLRDKLQRIETTTPGSPRRSVDAIRHDIECSVLAVWALQQTKKDQNSDQDHDHGIIIHLSLDSDPEILFRDPGMGLSAAVSSRWWSTLPALRDMLCDIATVTGSSENPSHSEEHPSGRRTSSSKSWRLTFRLGDNDTKNVSVNSRRPQYCVREYRLPSDRSGDLAILTRERQVSASTKFSLQELVSHRHNSSSSNTQSSSGSDGGGIDNTGNICVWDCALTLAWALLQQQAPPLLLQQQQQQKIHTVLELGAGMAAISALSLAVACPSCTQIYITDGHADCVQNNRVNVRLMQAAGLLSGRDLAVDCRQLRWTAADDDIRAVPATTDETGMMAAADWTLIADCTHFQEYHAALFWTAVQHTAIGGQIWLCQPDRDRSLERFLTLIRTVNETTSSSTSTDNDNDNNNNQRHSCRLLHVTERHYPTLDAKHEQFLGETHYDPNLHRPRIFVLTKERAATEQDRQCALHHMRVRDQPI